MADRYDILPFISRHCQSTLLRHKFAVTVSADKNGEEILRQKILIHLYTDKGTRLAGATKELIIRGSLRWSGDELSSPEFQTLWWDLPYGLEGTPPDWQWRPTQLTTSSRTCLPTSMRRPSYCIYPEPVPEFILLSRKAMQVGV